MNSVYRMIVTVLAVVLPLLAVETPTISVLYFSNLSPEKGYASLHKSMAEILIAELNEFLTARPDVTLTTVPATLRTGASRMTDTPSPLNDLKRAKTLALAAVAERRLQAQVRQAEHKRALALDRKSVV